MQFNFFLIFLVSVLICGSIRIGPLSLRVYMTILMLMYLIISKRPIGEKKYKVPTNYIYLFLICIGTLGIALLINGGLDEYAYWERCLAYYLVCVVAYFAVDYSVINKIRIDKIVFVMSLIVLLDAVVTTLQYQNNPLGWSIGSIFSNMDEFAYYLDEHLSYEGVSKLPGIIGRPVTNGFFLAVTTPMLLIGIGQKKSKKKIFDYIREIFYILTIMLALLAMFYLQQRAAFFLVLVVIAFHFLNSFVGHPVKFMLPIAIIILVALFVMPSNIGETELGRLSDMDNSSRTGLWSSAVNVFLDNPIFGNIIEYKQAVDKTAHNFLLDSLIDSGLFGFIPMLYLFIKTLIDAFRILLKSNNYYPRVFAYSVLVSMGMGMFHNTSYLTGDVIIFISLALMFKANLFAMSHLKAR